MYVCRLNIQSWLKLLSHRELGQHILCTSRGCSKAHRLQQKQHTQKQTSLSFPSLTRFQSFLCEGFPTGHVHHATVAVVHQVACFTVYATGRDAVSVEELWIHGCHLAVSPRRGQIDQLQQREPKGRGQRNKSNKNQNKTFISCPMKPVQINSS